MNARPPVSPKSSWKCDLRVSWRATMKPEKRTKRSPRKERERATCSLAKRSRKSWNLRSGMVATGASAGIEALVFRCSGVWVLGSTWGARDAGHR